MMELMQGLPDNVLGIVGSGTITGEDYDTVLIPAMKDKLQRHKKIRVLSSLRLIEGFRKCCQNAVDEMSYFKVINERSALILNKINLL